MQNTAEVEVLEIDGITLFIKIVVGKKGPDVSIRKV